MNTHRGVEFVERIRAKYGIDYSEQVGIVGTYCKAQTVDESNGNRDIESVITTGDIDSQYEVVVPGGADWTYCLRNGKAFLDHQYSFHNAVGSIRWINGVPNANNPTAWKARTRIYSKPGDPTGDQLLYVARESGIGASIGFRAMDYSQPTPEEAERFRKAGKPVPDAMIRRWEAIEYSFTAFPCNVACQGFAVEGETEKRLAAMDSMIVKGRITREFAAAIGFPTTPKRSLFTVEKPTTVVIMD